MLKTQHAASDYDEGSDNDQHEEEASQQGSPFLNELSEKTSWQMDMPFHAMQAESADQSSGLQAQPVSQQSYAALHAQHSGPQAYLQSNASAGHVASGQSAYGSLHAKRSTLRSADHQASWADPPHAVIADGYGDAAVRTSAGGFVWQPIRPDDRHSISEATQAYATNSDTLHAPALGQFQLPSTACMADTGTSYDLSHSLHQTAAATAQYASRADDRYKTLQLGQSAAQQRPASRQNVQQSWQTAESLPADAPGASSSYAADMGRQQDWSTGFDSSSVHRQRSASGQYASTSFPDAATDMWANNRKVRGVQSKYADADTDSRHLPQAQSSPVEESWQQDVQLAGMQSSKHKSEAQQAQSSFANRVWQQDGQQSADGSQGLLHASAELQASNSYQQSAETQIVKAAQSSMQVGSKICKDHKCMANYFGLQARTSASFPSRSLYKTVGRKIITHFDPTVCMSAEISISERTCQF